MRQAGDGEDFLGAVLEAEDVRQQRLKPLKETILRPSLLNILTKTPDCNIRILFLKEETDTLNDRGAGIDDDMCGWVQSRE